MKKKIRKAHYKRLKKTRWNSIDFEIEYDKFQAEKDNEKLLKSTLNLILKLS